MAKANSSLEVVLTPDDIPGAEPYEQHSVAALRWWLLCRYYCPTSPSGKCCKKLVYWLSHHSLAEKTLSTTTLVCLSALERNGSFLLGW